MSSAKVSVVVPAYNAEMCLVTAVHSILAQTLKDIEIWIVNDGSTDGTGGIADKLAQEDTRVKVIHQENQGAYMARLNALRQIKSPYFTCVDADDVVDSTMCEKMLDFAETENLDVVQCRMFGESFCENQVLKNRQEVEEGFIRPILFEGRDACCGCAKLHRNVYDFSKFARAPISMFDDLVSNLQFFTSVQRMGFLNEGLYHYQINEGSSVRNYKVKNLHDFLYTVNFREKMVPFYGWEKECDVLNNWIILNARNTLMVAASAPGWTLKERIVNVKKILNTKEVREAFNGLVKKTKDYYILLAVKTLPVVCISLLYFLKRTFRRCK